MKFAVSVPLESWKNKNYRNNLDNNNNIIKKITNCVDKLVELRISIPRRRL